MTAVVAQITDIHLRGPGELAHGVDTERCLLAAIDTLVQSSVPIDAAIVTGDITDRGRDEEYEQFSFAVRSLPMPVHAIPGNHDRSNGFTRALAGLADETADGDVAYSREIGDLRVVLLDTTVAGAGHGALSSERLRWLDRTLAESQRQPTLLAMHHPPFRIGIPAMDLINCRGGPELEAVLLRHRQVLAIACGHAHRSIFTSFAGRPASVAPSPSFAVRLSLDGEEIELHHEPPGIHLHIWSAEGGEFGTLMTHRIPIPAV